MRQLLFLLPLSAFILLAAYFGLGLTKDPGLIPSALIGKPAPTFDLPSLMPGEKDINEHDFKGKISIVNVFASWCVPCLAEHPIWMQIYNNTSIPIYGIAWKDKRESAMRWLEKHGNPYTKIGYDPLNVFGIEWGVYGAPETYIVDKNGRVRFKHVGPIFPKLWQSEIFPLVKKIRAEK